MKGLILAISAYTIWGCFPLYFNYLSTVLPIEVLSHRVIWSLFATLILAIGLHRFNKLVNALHDRKVIAWLGLSSVLIAINWLVYIWAISQHRIVESSLGYFITPLVSLVLARIVFKERLDRLQIWAGIIALVAILWEVVSLGQLPWISLVLSTAFALYGVVRKMCPVDGLSGLTIETLWLLPFALIWIFWREQDVTNGLAFGHDLNLSLLLIGSGIITALPLVLFATATRLIDLSIIGFIMYINPTMQFLIGVFILHEAFPAQRIVTFGLILIALILFMVGMWRNTQGKTADSIEKIT
ncbi:MAG: EamA family transporter RarD [Gammaproteobacteria bacterium]|nr:EamA family transporter RarD [Gammaproteobacteria bacterium]